MATTELDIVRWLQTNAEHEIFLPQNFLFQLQRQLTRGVKVMPSEQDCLEWIFTCLCETGPPNGDVVAWRSRINMCLAECRTNGKYTSRAKRRVTTESTLEQFK